ncbi:RCC1 domain-containing protein 1 isoform X1 [Tribolium madens]|uniref:RCC1 domain-containing protein 1 isoform X1 n=1 Tax=Tribolium madens TaxID=41895 RepID=UPI001CF764D9|nr:RCC1 domain-containing protein 1 isoform X1 [Tribolium madens]
MKVYYNGFNLHRQFPSPQDLVVNFIDHVYQDLENIEVSYHYAVLLVANVIAFRGAKNETIPVDGKIRQISCNEDKVLVLLTNGDLLKITETVIKVPKLMDLDDDDTVVQISTGSKLSVALTKKGHLYNVQNKLEFVSEDIIDVKTGREHCLLLDKSGKVFSFGRGSRGQLGHGCLDDELEPRFVEALGGIKIEVIESGGWHSCALSKDGDLYVWGWNGSGQLGLGGSDDGVSIMATPQVLDFDFNIKKVGCGNKHTVVLTDDGQLFGCGWNKYKQLKNDENEVFRKMIFLWDFSKEVVNRLKCGPWNTLVLCKE